MNDQTSTSAANPMANQDFDEPTTEQLHSALFAQMVMQQSNLALMLMGKTPHPETGKPMRDFEAARLFIDQLEMLEAKTKGNLNQQEAALLKQSLMTLRMAFVDSVNAPEPSAKPEDQTSPPASENAPAAENKTAPAETTGAASEEESRKRFSKKY